MRADYRPLLEWVQAQSAALRPELLRLSSLNSGSFNAAGVSAVAGRMADLYAPLQPQAEWIEVGPHRVTDDSGTVSERPLGPGLRLRKRPEAPLRIFLGGHLDTVYGIDHPFQSAIEVDADHIRGPGVADLKGGLLAMWLALAALERSPWRDRIGWEVVLNPDEEIGSAGSDPLLREAATRNHFGLIYEPAFADGGLASARRGSGDFDLVVHGRAAHAGRNPEEGRNAIVAAAQVVAAVHALNGQREGLTLNPGYLRGGGALNVVPELCVFKFNVRTAGADDEHWLHEQLDRIVHAAQGEGVRCELRGGFTRPPKPISEPMQRLMQWVGECGRELETPLAFRPTGGCCDGNNLAAYGLPNLDTLGVVGRDIHSHRETMRWSSLSERAQISALLLLRLASGEWSWT